MVLHYHIVQIHGCVIRGRVCKVVLQLFHIDCLKRQDDIPLCVFPLTLNLCRQVARSNKLHRYVIVRKFFFQLVHDIIIPEILQAGIDHYLIILRCLFPLSGAS